MLSGGKPAPPSGVCAVPGFVGRNAVPCAIALAVDVAVIVAVRNWVLVVACTAVLLALVAALPLLSRLLLRSLGSLVVPLGYERLNPAAAQRKALRASQARRRALPEATPSYRVRVVKPAAISQRHVLPGVVIDSETVRVPSELRKGKS